MQTTIAVQLINVTIPLDLELFQLEEALQAEKLAEETNSQIYCWKTIGRSNWLERGLSISDVLGLVVLPKGLPDLIDMLDDIIEE